MTFVQLEYIVIPTLAPYLLPLFVRSFTSAYPQVKLVVIELVTDLVVSRLREGRIDVGILVTPLIGRCQARIAGPAKISRTLIPALPKRGLPPDRYIHHPASEKPLAACRRQKG